MDSRRLAALLLAGGLACAAAERSCPPGTVADGERGRALLVAARGTQAGAGLTIDVANICFGGHGRGTVRPDGVVVLADALDERAAAARLTHMGMHVADGLHQFPVTGVPCDLQVETALAAEARAIVAEIAACEQLGCEPAPFGFAGEVLAATPAAREGLVLARLHAEPEADGLGELVRDYRTRCAREE